MNAIVPHSAAPVMTIGDVERVALAIAKGGLFGSKDPNAVLTLCLLAQAEGQHPAVVFRDYHIISGKPAKKAEAMLRDFISSGGKVEWHSLTDDVADATFSHPYGGTVRIDWTMERARQAGIANPMWKKYPRQMLRSRVISEGVRSVCPSATSGLYEVSEVQDITAEAAPINGQYTEVVEGAQGHSEEREVSPAAPAKRENWGGRYPTKSALWKASKQHHEELKRLGETATLDDLNGYTTAPEYADYVATALAHYPWLVEGPAPVDMPEYVPTFAIEAKARDLIAIRGNVPLELEGTN